MRGRGVDGGREGLGDGVVSEQRVEGGSVERRVRGGEAGFRKGLRSRNISKSVTAPVDTDPTILLTSSEGTNKLQLSPAPPFAVLSHMASKTSYPSSVPAKPTTTCSNENFALSCKTWSNELIHSSRGVVGGLGDSVKSQDSWKAAWEASWARVGVRMAELARRAAGMMLRREIILLMKKRYCFVLVLGGKSRSGRV